jgi:hypothetical protein
MLAPTPTPPSALHKSAKHLPLSFATNYRYGPINYWPRLPVSAQRLHTPTPRPTVCKTRVSICAPDLSCFSSYLLAYKPQNDKIWYNLRRSHSDMYKMQSKISSRHVILPMSPLSPRLEKLNFDYNNSLCQSFKI